MSATHPLKLNYYALALSILCNKSVEQSLRYFNIRPPQERGCKVRSAMVVDEVRVLAEQGLCKAEIKQRLNISREILDCAIERGGITGIDWRKRGFAYQTRLRREKNCLLAKC